MQLLSLELIRCSTQKQHLQILLHLFDCIHSILKFRPSRIHTRNHAGSRELVIDISIKDITANALTPYNLSYLPMLPTIVANISTPIRKSIVTKMYSMSWTG